MGFTKTLRAGILFAIAAAGGLSCGETEFTQPELSNEVNAPQAFERFLTSSQGERRELLIDGRVTDIEWNISGDPVIILLESMEGGRGGNYYVSFRSLWTRDQLNQNKPEGIYFLLQWPDLTEDRLEEPLVTSADVLADDGTVLINCLAGDNTLIQESSWSRSDLQEDEVFIELYSNASGSYPADVWRWGAETTDLATPVSPTEFPGGAAEEIRGATDHPGAGALEDFFDQGGGPVSDVGKTSFGFANHESGSNVPIEVADKGSRDVRLNRGKPTQYVVWHAVAKDFTACETRNPIRVDDASYKDKTWNPGDYVPSFSMLLPDSSQGDVLGKGAWGMGKWALEVRRDMIARPPDINGVEQTPRPDDVQLVPGGRYLMRITIVDGRTGAKSRSALFPLQLKP